MSPTITGIAAPPRFTPFELAYLLAGRDDASATRSREVFGIPVAAPGDATLHAGASSLVARGLIEQDQATILPRNEAGLVGFALGTAREWIALTVRVPEGLEMVVYVQAEGLAMMVRGGPAGTFDFVPTKPELGAREVARAAIVGLLGRSDVDVMIRAADHGQQRALFVRVRPEGMGIGRDPVFPVDDNWPAPELEIEPANVVAVEAAVDELLGALGQS